MRSRKESANWSLKIDEEIFEELYSIERRPFSPTNEIPNPTFEGVVILYSGKTFIVSGSIVSLNDWPLLKWSLIKNWDVSSKNLYHVGEW